MRAGYPALAEGYAHFDGAAGTLVAAGCADAIAEVTLRRGGQQVHRVRSRAGAALRIVADARAGRGRPASVPSPTGWCSDRARPR